jgi:hypothetical protein
MVSVTPRPRFSPGERTPGTHWIGGLGGHQSQSADTGYRSNPLPRSGIKPWLPGHPEVGHYTDWANPAPPKLGNNMQFRARYKEKVLIYWVIKLWFPVETQFHTQVFIWDKITFKCLLVHSLFSYLYLPFGFLNLISSCLFIKHANQSFPTNISFLSQSWLMPLLLTNMNAALWILLWANPKPFLPIVYILHIKNCRMTSVCSDYLLPQSVMHFSKAHSVF